MWVSLWVSRHLPGSPTGNGSSVGQQWPRISSSWPAVVSSSATPQDPPAVGLMAFGRPGVDPVGTLRLSYSTLITSPAHYREDHLVGAGAPLRGWNASFYRGLDPGLDLDLDLGRRPPAPTPLAPPMEASLFLRGLIILTAINSVFTLARAFGFALAGMWAAERTHDKLLGKC